MNFFDFHIFSLFLFCITILSYTLILPISQLQIQQLMTSQIRSYIEYIIRTYSYAHFIIKIGEKSSLVDDLMMTLDSGLIFWGRGPPCILRRV